jgi:hypothetical protein
MGDVDRVVNKRVYAGDPVGIPDGGVVDSSKSILHRRPGGRRFEQVDIGQKKWQQAECAHVLIEWRIPWMGYVNLMLQSWLILDRAIIERRCQKKQRE